MDLTQITSAQRLGYGQVLALAAAHVHSSLGREALLSLKPSEDRVEIERRCARLAELWILMEAQSPLPLQGLRDVREALDDVAISGTVLEPPALQEIAGLAHVIDRVHAHLTDNAADSPHLAADLERLHPSPDVHREIERCLTPAGDVADAASPALGRLRRERRRLETSIRAELDAMLRDSNVSALLQDSYHTERAGRHVLPLAVNNRGKIPGIVHDRSASGETLFVEPMQIVELTNDATEARLAEEAEVLRILAALSDLVRAHREPLLASIATLGELDALAAVADWGHANALRLTDRDTARPLRLLAAHHPLLWLHQREKSVPLDLALGPGDRAVVISGPNAGGKTTALKTVGLLHLMTQAGLPVPADAASNIPVPRRIHADIGDDQDVVAGLSTFTAHVTAIAAICEAAGEGSLVLLDELGTATDPQEGGALAVAILEALHARGCLTIATSHLALLKQWAHESDGVQNASVSLDAETHRPTYRLQLGLPGPSEALTVAGQVGLSDAILSRAREMVPEQEQRLSALIADLQSQATHLKSLSEEAEQLRARLTESERTHRDAAEAAEKERRAFRRDLAKERRRLLAEAKAEIEQRIAHLPSKRELLVAKQELESDIRAEQREMAESALSPAQGGGDFRVGDTVEILDANEQGRVALVQGEKIQVETKSGITITVKADRLSPSSLAQGAAGTGTGAGGMRGKTERGGSVTFTRRDDVSPELKLIGVRVEPALEMLDKFLDEAASHGLERVRVIHGFGKGALRKAVREFADGHPLVQRWSSADPAAGGHAVTVMELS